MYGPYRMALSEFEGHLLLFEIFAIPRTQLIKKARFNYAMFTRNLQSTHGL